MTILLVCTLSALCAIVGRLWSWFSDNDPDVAYLLVSFGDFGCICCTMIFAVLGWLMMLGVLAA